ncbi:MAG TPA: hypothetical protein VG713_16545, partial [Pirellulales bacterium]|nr:hypothetical protein [Pirellulales bacterium]
LGEHRAVVIVGHVHRWGVVVRQTERGPFVQCAVSSILTAADESPRQLLDGVDRYGPELVELEPSFSAGTKAERRAILEAERPFVRYFEYAQVAGHLRFRLAGNALSLDVMTGTRREPWRTLDVDRLLVV